MNLGDLIGAGVTAVGGGLRGQNAGDDELYRRRQLEQARQDDLSKDASAEQHLNVAESLRRYAAEHQASADDARASYYNQRLATLQNPKLAPPRPGTPEYNASALDLYGKKKAIDAKYSRRFPSYTEMEGRRKQAQAQQAEESQGTALMSQLSKQQWHPFWRAYQSVQAADPSLTPGRAAARAWKALSGANADFVRPKASEPVVDTPPDTTAADSTDSGPGFFDRIGQGAEHWWQQHFGSQDATDQSQGDDDLGEPGADSTTDIENQRADWDELQRLYGKERTEQQVGPRP